MHGRARLWGGGIAVLSLGLYLAGLCRQIYWYDSAEYTAAALTLGIPHPPGYPLYTLLGYLATRLPLAPPLAMNGLSALSAALAVGLCFALTRRLGSCVAGAVLAAGLLGTAPAFWHNALIAEVYAPGLCFTLALLLLLLPSAQDESATAERALWLAPLVAGLGLGVHYSLATCGLGYAWLWLARAGGLAGLRRRPAQLARGLTGLAAGLSVFLYIPLRAGAGGTPDHALPWSASRFAWLVSGGNYRHWFGDGAPVTRILADLMAQPGLWAMPVAAVGAWQLTRRTPRVALALALCLLGNLAFFLRYRVADVEVFLLPSAALLCILAGLGASAVLQRAPARAGLGTAAAGLALALVAGRAASSYAARDLSRFNEAADFAEGLLRALPPQAVILSYTSPPEWKRDAVFGLYYQGVLGRRPDVVVAKQMGRAQLDRLLREERPTYLYAPVDHVMAEYRTRPEHGLLRLTARR